MQGALQAESYTYRLNQSFSPRSYQSDLKAIKQPRHLSTLGLKKIGA
jgi:hypothetical protein